MNKITELKQAAGLYVDTSGRWANADAVDKFAELIIEACLTEVTLCYGEGREIPIDGGGHYHSEDWDAALTQVIANIRHYLGDKK